jgi:biotin carboxyl carrier protein
VCILLTAVVLAACGVDDDPTIAGVAAPTSTSTSTTLATTTTTSTTTTLPPTTTTTTAPAPVRVVTEQDWLPFATVAELTLHHPSRRVERVGFHQSNNDGALPFEPLPTAVAATVLEDRQRDTHPQGAADIVADPAAEIRAPVTGTVIRGGPYVLYCEYSDNFLVIEPDAHPGWEVKILHIGATFVGRGDHVVAGETVIAPGPTQLPFESQVDELRTADPAWPHVHIEVVDPTIPDRPTPGGCG